jgi:hypothetical protein
VNWCRMKMSVAYRFSELMEQSKSAKLSAGQVLKICDPDYEVRRYLETEPVIRKAINEVVSDIKDKFGEGYLDTVLRGDDAGYYLCLRIHTKLDDALAMDMLEERLDSYDQSCLSERLGRTSIVVFGKR